MITHHPRPCLWDIGVSSHPNYFKTFLPFHSLYYLFLCNMPRTAMTNLDSILKSRDITLPTKVHIVKAMVFPVVMYGCESWTIKKAKCQRIDVFELWYGRRLLRVPWTVRRSNQWILKGNQSWIFIGMTDAETPILWPSDAKNWLIGKDPDSGKDWRQEEKGTTMLAICMSSSEKCLFSSLAHVLIGSFIFLELSCRYQYDF